MNLSTALCHSTSFYRINNHCHVAVATFNYQHDYVSTTNYLNNSSLIAPSEASIFQRISPSLLQQRLAVRQLFRQLLTHLSINDQLDESSYPYRLTNKGSFVCFSHSKNQVAVLLHHSRPVGVDIETQPVKWSLVQRFFHPKEVALLSALATPLREKICGYLWQIKECVVKVENTTLIPTLARNHCFLIAELVAALTCPPPLTFTTTTANHSCQILLNSNQQSKLVTLPSAINSTNRLYQVHLLPQWQLSMLC